ncbi:MAG: hypothetical protein ACRDIF_07020 [Actinomycetota bacterium]
MKFRFLSALTILMAVLGAAGGAEWAAALASRPANLTHVVQHWGEVVDAAGDDDLSIESFFEDDAQTDIGQEE